MFFNIVISPMFLKQSECNEFLHTSSLRVIEHFEFRAIRLCWLIVA